MFQNKPEECQIWFIKKNKWNVKYDFEHLDVCKVDFDYRVIFIPTAKSLFYLLKIITWHFIINPLGLLVRYTEKKTKYCVDHDDQWR